MPFRPKAFDVWTIGDVKNLLCLAKASNPKLKSVAFINQTDANSQTDIKEAQTIISECKEIFCLPCSIGTRKSFGNAATEGLSVMELESEKKSWIQKAQQEMQTLYDLIYV